MKIKLPNWAINAIIRYAQRTPYFDLPGYMLRWWLKRPRGQIETSDTCEAVRKGWSICIHNTLSSDTDRAMHDHPWWNISWVLRGGYWEIMPCPNGGADLRVWRGPGSIVFRKADARHRLVIPEGTTSWSMFFRGPWRRDWGFHTAYGWVYWRDYLGGLLDDTGPDGPILQYAKKFGTESLYQVIQDMFADCSYAYDVCKLDADGLPSLVSRLNAIIMRHYMLQDVVGVAEQSSDERRRFMGDMSRINDVDAAIHKPIVHFYETNADQRRSGAQFLVEPLPTEKRDVVIHTFDDDEDLNFSSRGTSND